MRRTQEQVQKQFHNINNCDLKSNWEGGKWAGGGAVCVQKWGLEGNLKVRIH
jgi:hypothetical protein